MKEPIIEQRILEEALAATIIGVVTAFAVLVILMIVIVMVKLASARLFARQMEYRTTEIPQVDDLSRDTALAAAVAVTALSARQDHHDVRERDDG